jgi:hypothetical protein
MLGELRRRADLPVTLAIVLLLAVLGWRMALVRLAPTPLVAASLLPPSTVPAGSARQVLVVDERASGDWAARALTSDRFHSAYVVRVPWTHTSDARSPASRLAALVRAYGYSDLPVLLTLNTEGQVVRVRSLVDAR